MSNFVIFFCYFRTPLKIKIHRLENLLALLKWLAFLTCLALCIWKIADSFITFGEKEVGTKIELKYNHETDLPGFAVCRHPNQILKKIDDLGSKLVDSYDLKLSDIRYLTAFENAGLYGVNTYDIYSRFVFNDSESVTSLVLSSRGQYAGTSTPSLVSKPLNNSDEWSSFWHPIYGVCFSFKPKKSLVDYVGEAGLEFVKVNLNFEFAFPAPREEEIIEEFSSPYEPVTENETQISTDPPSLVAETTTQEVTTTEEASYYVDLDEINNSTDWKDETDIAGIELN